MTVLEEKLETYETLLRKWQQSINLVGPETLDNAKQRHFADSLQLTHLIPRFYTSSHDSGRKGAKGVLFDFGSGAGFPGMVLAMARPDLEVHLIDSDAKKCTFLRAVSRETDTPVEIHNMRIDALNPQDVPPPDIVTARALAALEKLLEYAWPWVKTNPDTLLLFLKGVRAASEIELVQKHYSFSHEVFNSETSTDGRVLRMTNIRRRR